LDNNSSEKIKYTSFKLFLEKGYEATSIRDICEEVGIKASTLYFYYKSKEQLFFYIYNDIFNNYINHLENIKEIYQEITPEKKLYAIFKNTIEFCSKDLSSQKFLLRYHLFTPLEIAIPLNDYREIWINKQNEIIRNIIMECCDGNILRSENVYEFLLEYNEFQEFHLYKMIVFGIKPTDKQIDNLWINFWNNRIVNN
jgi:AcrR family transcriptional regulator